MSDGITITLPWPPAELSPNARLIWKLGTLPRPKSEIADRRRAVLADWMALGHDEQELRRTAKEGPWYAPTGPEPSMESAPRKSAKRR